MNEVLKRFLVGEVLVGDIGEDRVVENVMNPLNRFVARSLLGEVNGGHGRE